MPMRKKGKVSNKTSKRPRGLRPLPIGGPNKSTRTGGRVRVADLPSGIKRGMIKRTMERLRDPRGHDSGRGILREDNPAEKSGTANNRAVKGKRKR